MSLNIYYAKDADPAHLADKKIAILGYGSQGRAHALNLKDSGFEVMVGVRPDGKTMAQAKSDGVQAGTVEEACAGAALIAFLFPDPSQPRVFNELVAPGLKPGQIILVAHGFNLHYGQMIPPPEVDVIMIAPKGPGNLVRELYKLGQGIPSLLAVHQDASGRAKEFALAYAHGLGATRAGVVETTIQEETETDLFGEQAVICGGVSSLIKAGYETLTQAGYAPEMAFFECCHEMKLIVDLIYQGGMKRMRKVHQRHGQVRRHDPGTPGHRRECAGPDAGDIGQDPERRVRPGVDHGEPGQPAGLQRPHGDRVQAFPWTRWGTGCGP